MKFVFTSEHGGNIIPEKYQSSFVNANAALNSHRGIDYGSQDLFLFCKSLSDFSKSNTVSRLLIELNRSKHHPKLFSEFSDSFKIEDKAVLISEFYDPYRDNVEAEILRLIKKGEEVIHISFHSFTPVLNGDIRKTDIGILYDPSRKAEKSFSGQLKQNLKAELPDFRIRYNYPYLGTADGFTTYLRNKFPENYAGIELEINQKFVENENYFPLELKSAIFHALYKLKNTLDFKS